MENKIENQKLKFDKKMDIKKLSKDEIKLLELWSDKVRKGIPISFKRAVLVIKYQEELKKNKKWWQFWK